MTYVPYEHTIRVIAVATGGAVTQGAVGIPDVLDHYRLVEKIGAGGMGEVYRAQDEHLHREVAVKVLHPGAFANEVAHQRFRKEAEALSRLNSAHIATVHDFGAQDGIDFLVMEYVGGQSLTDLIAQGPVPEGQVTALATQLAEGLSDAHAQGIVHRDIKPGNLRLTSDGRLKILDFGIARLLVSGDARTETVVTGNAIIGTFAYLTPEQLEGKPAQKASDIYAAGVVLYELATGRLPYGPTTETSLLQCILRQAPRPPRCLRPELDGRLEEIILKCLEKVPGDRYASAQELAADLRALAGKPASSSMSAAVRGGLRTARRAWRTIRRVSVLVPSSVAVVAIVIAFWLFGSRPALSLSPTDSVLVADFDNQTGEAGLDAPLQTAFTVSLQQSTRGNLVPHSRVQDALRRMGRPEVKHIDEVIGREICLRENVRALLTITLSKLGARYIVSARLIDPNTGDVARAFMEHANSSDRLLDAVGTIAKDVRSGMGESLYSIQKRNRPLPEVTTPSLSALTAYANGGAAWHNGGYEEAVRFYEVAVQQDPNFAMAHQALATAYYSFIFHDVVRGKQHCDRALALVNRTTERERMVIQCECASAQNHVDEAVRAYRALLQVYPNDAVTHNNFASLLRGAQRDQEAIEQLQEVLRLLPNNASAYVNIATSYAKMNNVPEALKYYAKALDKEPQLLMDRNFSREYGFRLVYNGEEERAVAIFKNAMQSPAAKMHSQRSLALLDFYHGRYRSGIQWLREAVLTTRVDNDSLGEARNHLFLAIAHDSLGERAAVFAELAAAEKCLQRLPPSVWMTVRIGSFYARIGALNKANQLLGNVSKMVDPKSPANVGDYHWLQGEIELARHKYGSAAELLQLASRENPTSLPLEGLAKARLGTGDVPGAIAAYSELIDQGNAELGWEGQQPWTVAHYSAAALYASNGDKRKAIALLDSLLLRWKAADRDFSLAQEARRLRATLD